MRLGPHYYFLFVLGFWVQVSLNRPLDPPYKNKMCGVPLGVPGAKIGHSQLCFVVIHNVIIILANGTPGCTCWECTGNIPRRCPASNHKQR
jgi:hypothetical protein